MCTRAYRVPGALLSVQRGIAWLSPPAMVTGGSTIYDPQPAEVETDARRDDETGMGRAARAQGELGCEPRLFSCLRLGGFGSVLWHQELSIFWGGALMWGRERELGHKQYSGRRGWTRSFLKASWDSGTKGVLE